MSVMETELDRADHLRIAALAVVDPRTVRRYLAGRRVAEHTRVRIVRALRKLALEVHAEVELFSVPRQDR